MALGRMNRHEPHTSTICASLQALSPGTQRMVWLFLRMADNQEDSTVYSVVMNHEEQYSIWPAGRDLPPGWKAAGKTGSKSECLAYIEQVWTDMRPLSLRQRMSES